MHASGAGKQWYFVLRAVCGWWFLFVTACCQAVRRTCLCQNAVLECHPRPCAGQGQCCALTPPVGVSPQQDLNRNYEPAPCEPPSTAAWLCLPFANGCGWIRPKLPGVGVMPIPAAILCQIQSRFGSLCSAPEVASCRLGRRLCCDCCVCSCADSDAWCWWSCAALRRYLCDL